LTALFESIAMIVDQHQPVVEKYYGLGKMHSVVKRLLSECDRVVKGIIEGWEEERTMKRKVNNSCIIVWQCVLMMLEARRHHKQSADTNVLSDQ
jgi:hypothetical protein